ncbi:hypothetical protein LENED_009992 [Lentinula edodes]|uniref:Secreted protein n=1 Tax=Lentinula edodes TaxID=5353 RepID=A0A1Q3EL86_LENED|nr:hypothetical protein LENED_009992 [Lentinula edodes]
MKFFVTLGFLLIAMNAVLSVNALLATPEEKACGHFGSSHNGKSCSYKVKTKKGTMVVNGTCLKKRGLKILRHYTCVPAGATPASSTAAASTAAASPASATAAANMDSSSGTTGAGAGAGAGAAGAGAATGTGTSTDGTSAGDGSMRRRKRHWSSREPREQEDMVAN